MLGHIPHSPLRTDATQWRPYLKPIGAQPYLETKSQRETGDRMIGWGLMSQANIPVSPCFCIAYLG